MEEKVKEKVRRKQVERYKGEDHGRSTAEGRKGGGRKTTGSESKRCVKGNLGRKRKVNGEVERSMRN